MIRSTVDGGTIPACFAPHSALYLQPDGIARACCATGFALGTVTGRERQSLRRIWDGAARQAQRSALERGSYEFGCQECEHAERAGGRSAALAVHFDRFATQAALEYPKMIDFALSNRCNLQCVMCNGDLSSAIRSRREGRPPLPGAYDDQFFEELVEFLPHLERAQFKGGEPFLAHENERVWDLLIKTGSAPEVTVTTNGTVFNERVERYVRELRMEPNVSIDGMTARTIEAVRVGVDAAALWRNVDRFQELASDVGRTLTLSYCLMTVTWQEMGDFLREASARGVNANVIFVSKPARFDLLRLPRNELSRVLRELDAAIGAFASDAVTAAWDATRSRISSALTGDPVVDVTAPAWPGMEFSDSAEGTAVRAALTAEFGCSPLVLSFDGGLLDSVDVPAWARWLAPQTWRGTPFDDLESVVEASSGCTVHGAPFPVEARGMSRFRLTLHSQRRTQVLVAHLMRVGQVRSVLIYPEQNPNR